ncbi:ubiquinol-cytochrome c reductase complex assembly factor 1-like [Tribolium castaneum]|uniref:ubiquinol-cytochrome c reductase complex assembly factor 1-like n=1 Tax=Tribolium castaneum TaxID=7070 RepID=UPI0030FE22BE
MELCLWMYAARASAEGHKGAVLREQMVEVLKSDVSQRLVVLKSENPDFANVDVDELFKGVRQTLLDYDEALHGDDAVLAGILWTKFYHTREISDNYLRTLLKLVKKIKLYVKGKPEPFNTFTLQPKYIVMLN